MSRRLGRREVVAATQPLVEAFWQYPETVHLLPNVGRRRHVLPRYLLADVRDAARFDLLLGAELDGRIAGAAAWIPPEAYPVSIRRQALQVMDLLPALPWGWSALREALRGQNANRARHQVHPPHYYLRAVGVAPHDQGRGIGSTLIAPVLTIADAQQVGCFLQTATQENVTWYQRFGFEVADEYRPTPTWPTVWAMWREPAAAEVRR